MPCQPPVVDFASNWVSLAGGQLSEDDIHHKLRLPSIMPMTNAKNISIFLPPRFDLAFCNATMLCCGLSIVVPSYRGVRLCCWGPRYPCRYSSRCQHLLQPVDSLVLVISRERFEKVKTIRMDTSGLSTKKGSQSS